MQQGQGSFGIIFTAEYEKKKVIVKELKKSEHKKKQEKPDSKKNSTTGKNQKEICYKCPTCTKNVLAAPAAPNTWSKQKYKDCIIIAFLLLCFFFSNY